MIIRNRFSVKPRYRSWLTALRDIPGHEFWPDDVSLLEDEHSDASRPLSVGSLTNLSSRFGQSASRPIGDLRSPAGHNRALLPGGAPSHLAAPFSPSSDEMRIVPRMGAKFAFRPAGNAGRGPLLLFLS